MKYTLVLIIVLVAPLKAFGQQYTKDHGNRKLPFDSIDVQILKHADNILASESLWSKKDDRKCQDDIDSNQYSLFCALYKASLDILDEYDHRRPGLQQVRWIIDEQYKDRLAGHRLMDFNNHEKTTFEEIKKLLAQSLLITKQKVNAKE